jgi:hypothetical protein
MKGVKPKTSRSQESRCRYQGLEILENGLGGGGKATRLARVPSVAPCRGQPRVYQNGQAM